MRKIVGLGMLWACVALVTNTWGAPLGNVGETLTKRVPMAVELVLPESVGAAENVEVGVRLAIAEGFHAYGPRKVGAAALTWELPAGVTVQSVRWPQTKEIVAVGEKFAGYENEALLRVTLAVKKGMHSPQRLAVKMEAVACSDTMCVPVVGEASGILKLGGLDKPLTWEGWQPDVVAQVAIGWQGLLVAMAGGILLNFMPCVFPVLGIKILSFAKNSGGDKKQTVLQALAYAGGIVASLLALGAVLVAVRVGGEAIGWGFQLQNPSVVWVLVLIMAAVAANLNGMWDWKGISVEGKAGAGLWGAFGSGVLMVIVASPCAGPFLAVALGALVGASAWTVAAIMTAVGLGLAAPYVVLAGYPAAMAGLAKPGAWMETLKNFLAFPMWGTVVYLLWILAGQVDAGVVLKSALAVVVALVGVWLATKAKGIKWVAVGAMGLAAMAAVVGWPMRETIQWESWSNARQGALVAEGRTVLVDYTARWCATCQANEALVAADSGLQDFIKTRDVALLKADWTNPSVEIAKSLSLYGRASVPTWVVIKGEKVVVLPEIISAGAIRKAVETVEK